MNAACLRRIIAIRAARITLQAAMPAAWTIGRTRTAILRVRWAWRCRKPPARTEGDLDRADYLTFVGLVETWRQSDPPERSRT